MGQKRINLRKYKSEDELQIINLYKDVFGLSRSKERWEWQFKKNTQGESWVMLAEDKEQIIGQYALRRNNINFLGNEVVACQTCDIMVNPKYRGKGLFNRLTTECGSYASEKGLKALFGFPNRNAYPGLMRKPGRHKIANLKTYYFRIGIRKVLGNLFDKALKNIFSVPNSANYFLLKKIIPKKTTIVVSSELDKNIASVLEDCHNYEVISIWKDMAYMKWRYEQHPEYRYDFHILYINTRAEGLAVCRHSGESVAICEFMHRTKNLRQSVLLLRHIVKYYFKTQAQKIEFNGWDNGFFDYVFEASGFKTHPSDFVVVARAFNDERLEKMLMIPQNWTIVFGDMDII